MFAIRNSQTTEMHTLTHDQHEICLGTELSIRRRQGYEAAEEDKDEEELGVRCTEYIGTFDMSRNTEYAIDTS